LKQSEATSIASGRVIADQAFLLGTSAAAMTMPPAPLAGSCGDEATLGDGSAGVMKDDRRHQP
jgi:hypothetical protein